MIVLKSTHNAALAQKDALVASLQSEVRFLRALLQPIESPRAFRLNTEANAVLDGKQDQIDVETDESVDLSSERSRILSGTY